ncbi:MAG: hydroxyacid dehydrogenase [Alphaproteobacteria bacterium]|nr:hydroxyacid dehydrogenase [Alphaproteobacteria bacterium]
MNVVFQFDAGPALAAELARLSVDGLRITPCPEGDMARFLALMADADALLHVLRPITAEIIAQAPKLKLIQKIGVGVNTIDLEAAKSRGIKVANMPGTNTRAVAETTLLLMLAALRRLPTFDQATRRGQGWSLDPAIYDAVGELAGKVVGLVGYGAVGRMLAPILRVMGADVIYSARTMKPDALARWRELPDLLAEADIISLHLPLLSGTVKLIDATAVARMKPGVVFVNTSRGGLVDEPALVAALGSGQIRAAGLDVFSVEPVELGNPLLKMDNVVFFPHIAWLTPETLTRSLEVAIDNCRRILRGQEIAFRIA